MKLSYFKENGPYFSAPFFSKNSPQTKVPPQISQFWLLFEHFKKGKSLLCHGGLDSVRITSTVRCDFVCKLLFSMKASLS